MIGKVEHTAWGTLCLDPSCRPLHPPHSPSLGSFAWGDSLVSAAAAGHVVGAPTLMRGAHERGQEMVRLLQWLWATWRAGWCLLGLLLRQGKMVRMF